MKVTIYSPARNSMQSGLNKTGYWVIEFPPQAKPAIDPLMGWNGMPDTTQELKLSFENQEQAIEYAKRNGLDYVLAEPKKRVIKPKSYAKNFEFKRGAEA